MKNIAIVVGVLGIIVAGGTVFALSTKDDQNQSMTNTIRHMQTTTSSMDTVTEDTVVANYIDYEEGIIESTEGTKIVYFHADWCITCNRLQDDVFENGIREDVTFIKADYDTEMELRQRYNVTLQTFTVLVDDDGNEIASHYAGTDPRVDAVLDAFGI